MRKNILVILSLFLICIMSGLAHADSAPQHPCNLSLCGDVFASPVEFAFSSPQRPYKHPLWGDTSPVLLALIDFYKVDKIPIQSIGQNLTDPLDIHPTLFLAKAASLDPMKIYEQRVQGDSWMTIVRNNSINPIILYTPLENIKPPAQFDHAYAQREYLAKDPKYQMKLYDSEVRDLLALKFCVDALNITPQELFNRMYYMDLKDIIVETVYNNAGEAVPPSLQRIR
ncbi:MAG: hypothetical protein V2A78_12405 [bacterium]